ncbi:hypothetical protein H0E87_019755 [Populus deltoides]|uniref:PGG domain-containing protein n=1 Tax=Populus deltoides TaxID=3696 RepID=A0A8T2XWH1_POPDE|nr:hypothetical protein H0E87_019755 [Populus deltoides]
MLFLFLILIMFFTNACIMLVGFPGVILSFLLCYNTPHLLRFWHHIECSLFSISLFKHPPRILKYNQSAFSGLTNISGLILLFQIVNELLSLPDTNVNALTRDHKTALDLAEELTLSEESSDIKECLSRYGALRANELNQPRDELRKTVTQIKNDVHTQLEQTRRTNKNVHNISKELRKLHREGINNATNSVTVVAVLFATVAFAAIFTVPGGDRDSPSGDRDSGTAVMVTHASFKIFFIFNAIALFTSLAVVVVQITLVRGETKAERRVVEVINKLMWLASVCTSVAFMASSYIVVGPKHEWAALLITIIGGVIMAGVLGTMTYYVVKSKRIRSMRKKDKHARRSGSSSWHHNSEFSNSEVDRIFAL